MLIRNWLLNRANGSGKLFTGTDSGTLLNPAQWLIEGIGGGAVLAPEQAAKNSNVAACVSILADDIGKLPIHTFNNQKKDIGMKHPVAKLLYERPNPFMSAFVFKQTIQGHIGIYGNGIAYIKWGPDGYPVALWPLDPVRTFVQLDAATGTLHYRTQNAQGEVYDLKPDEVLHFKAFTRDGIIGIPPWKTLIDELDSQNALKSFICDFYHNSTLSSGILKTATKLNAEAKEKVRSEWEKLNSGKDNQGKIAVLDVGLDFHQLGMPLDQAQFLDTQKFGITEVAKVYRVPPHKLAQLDRATYANAEAMGLDYIKTTLLPIFTQWEQEINYKLFTETERASFYVKFNAAAELRGDSTARAGYYRDMLNNGIYTINEIREMEEMDGIGKNGDKHFVSLNYTTLDQVGQQTASKGGEGENGQQNE
uniref:Portal protein n=1 Tax=Siphoviridae sp. ctFH16 TaxID=2827817 RepID=A0A8S5TN45_9CAUD|nr:MAG TPA: portal protein [Siphoviridae sp. ctFH16]